VPYFEICISSKYATRLKIFNDKIWI
jgi:hypothetical protein